MQVQREQENNANRYRSSHFIFILHQFCLSGYGGDSVAGAVGFQLAKALPVHPLHKLIQDGLTQRRERGQLQQAKDGLFAALQYRSNGRLGIGSII